MRALSRFVAAVALAAPAIVFTAITPAVHASILGPAEGYGVFVFGNMNQTSDSIAPIAVGGNATFSSYSVASGGSNSATNLVVGGNLTMTYGSVKGNAIVGGDVNWNGPTVSGKLTVNGTANLTGGGSVNGGVFYHTAYNGPSYITHSSITSPASLPVDFASAKSTLQATSAGLYTLSPTGSTANPYNSLTFTGSNSSLNIFTVNASALSSATSITVNVPSGATVLINVTSSGGGSISLPNVGFTLDASRTLWNLGQFSNINTSSFKGSVLAPNADVSYGSGSFYGTLVANSVHGGGEFDGATFTGTIPPPTIPEPASIALLALGGTALLARRRRIGE